MRLSVKHSNQQTVTLSDFSGGLNTAAREEMIGENQLSEVVNMESDGTTGLLRTVKGTTRVLEDLTVSITAAAYDAINKCIILFNKDRRVFAVSIFDMTELTYIGDLSGKTEPMTTMWEDGLLVASGGHLQYIKGLAEMETIETSPEVCKGVYVRSGRVLVFDDEDYVRYSSVGDEETWEENLNDPSSGVWLQIGYKVGGKILGMVNLSTDILVLKDNGMVFRLQNEYPDWVLTELGRNIFCKGAAAYCNVGDGVLILGNTLLQTVTTTTAYGDMKPTQIGQAVKHELTSLPPCTKLRFVPPLNQVWCVANDQWVMIYDCNTASFTQRYFNQSVVDVIPIDEKIYVIRPMGIDVMDEASGFQDDDKPLIFHARFKTDIGLHDILVKRVEMSITPLIDFYDDANSVLQVGKLTIPFPTRKAATEPQRKQTIGETQQAIEKESTYLYDGTQEDVWLNPENVTPGKSVLLKVHKIFRGDRVGAYIKGSGFPFILNYIHYDKVEV